MIKSLFLIFFFLIGPYSSKADDVPSVDRDFMQQLNVSKDPFQDGFPKAKSVEIQAPVVFHRPVQQKHIIVRPPKPKAVVVPVILPELHLQGVIVGGDVYEAIIEGSIVSLNGVIGGAKVISVDKTGVGLLYKGKKFFLKVE